MNALFEKSWKQLLSCKSCSVGCLVRYSTYSTYSKEPGESGCSVACLVRYSTYSTYSKGSGDCEGSAAWCLPGIASRPRHLPGIGALPSPRQGIPRKKQGLPPSILLSPQDCLLQSCCHPRIEGNSTRNSTPGRWRGREAPMPGRNVMLESTSGTCAFEVPRNWKQAPTIFWLLPAWSSELEALPSPRQGRDSSQEKMSRLSSKPTTVKNYLASSNPHPPHSRAYDRLQFLRILETSSNNYLHMAWPIMAVRHSGYASAEATASPRTAEHIAAGHKKPLVYGCDAQERAATKVSPLRPGEKHGMLQTHFYIMACYLWELQKLAACALQLELRACLAGHHLDSVSNAARRTLRSSFTEFGAPRKRTKTTLTLIILATAEFSLQERQLSTRSTTQDFVSGIKIIARQALH